MSNSEHLKPFKMRLICTALKFPSLKGELNREEGKGDPNVLTGTHFASLSLSYR